MNYWIRGKQFNPDILRREVLSKTDIGYRKVMAKDSSLLPLSHEKVPSQTIYSYGEPATVMSIGSNILEGESYIYDLKILVLWLKGFLSPLFGPGKMYKMIQTDRGLTLKASNLRLVSKHLSIKHPFGEIILGSGLSVGKIFGDHSIYTSLLTTLIIDKCLEMTIKGYVKLRDCLEGLIIFNRIFEKLLEEFRMDVTSNKLSEEDILRYAKILDNGPGVNTLIQLAIKIANDVPGEIFQQKPIDNILDFRTMETGSVSESEVVNGVAFPKEFPHYMLPKRVRNAKIAVIKSGLTIPNYVGRHHKIMYSWDDRDSLSRSLANKTRLLREYVENLFYTGANVIVVEKGVDESVFEIFKEHNAVLVRGLSPPELDIVAEASGAKPVPSFHTLDLSDLGYAGLVEYLKVNGKDWIFFRNCLNSSRLTVILKGYSLAFNQDFEETLKDAVRFIGTIRREPSFIPGGGVTEIMIANHLTEFARKMCGRTSMVLEAIAEAFEQLVSILLYNMGLDPMEILAGLRMSLNGGTVLDSFQVKLTAIENAIAAANTVLRVDSFIKARKYSDAEVSYLKRIKGLSKENKRRIRRDYDVETLEI
ncbi:MAG: TCP-1/cpn60 chaperonin family protein [Nitrososphaerota archaeon]